MFGLFLIKAAAFPGEAVECSWPWRQNSPCPGHRADILLFLLQAWGGSHIPPMWTWLKPRNAASVIENITSGKTCSTSTFIEENGQIQWGFLTKTALHKSLEGLYYPKDWLHHSLPKDPLPCLQNRVKICGCLSSAPQWSSYFCHSISLPKYSVTLGYFTVSCSLQYYASIFFCSLPLH